MPTLPSLAEAARLAIRLGVEVDDPQMLEALRSTSARFRGDAGWSITPTETVNLRLDGHGRAALRLPATHITAVTSVRLYPDIRELVEGRDWQWSTDGIIQRIGEPWPDMRRAIEVTYTAGYDPVPEDIQTAVLDQSEARAQLTPGIVQRNAGIEGVRFDATAVTGVTQQWVEAVARYSTGGDRA